MSNGTPRTAMQRLVDSQQTQDTADAPLAPVPPPTEGSAGAIAQLNYFSQTADVLGSCNLLPRHIKTKGDCVAIMMAGAELGLPPMKAIRGLIIVEGKIELSADVMLALVKQHGYKVRWVETNERVACLSLIDPRDPDHTHTQAFSMEDAARAGLATKQNWRNYPAAMLRARVISASVRAFCPEVLAGAYHEGEIGGFEERGAEAPVMHAKDDVDTQAAIELTKVQMAQAESSGDRKRIERATANYHAAKQDRIDAQDMAGQSEEQERERELVDGWCAELASLGGSEELLDWIHENGGAYRLCVFWKDKAREAIKKATLAINEAEERKKGKDWITQSALKEMIDAAPACEPDEEDETDVDFGHI